MKYRKRPIEVEAWQIPGTEDSASRFSAPIWLVSALLSGKVMALREGGVTIETLEGVLRGDVGDWIIQGVKGELYPCKPDIFDATYEAVPEARAA